MPKKGKKGSKKKKGTKADEPAEAGDTDELSYDPTAFDDTSTAKPMGKKKKKTGITSKYSLTEPVKKMKSKDGKNSKKSKSKGKGSAQPEPEFDSDEEEEPPLKQTKPLKVKAPAVAADESDDDDDDSEEEGGKKKKKGKKGKKKKKQKAKKGCPDGKILYKALMEKCSDGKKATTLGALRGKWDTRYVVITDHGVWWYETEEDYKRAKKKNTPAKGSFDKIASCELNYDDERNWVQFCLPDRVLSLRPADRYEDCEELIEMMGNKTNLNLDQKSGRKVQSGVAKCGTWEEYLVNQNGKVISDMGTSMHAANKYEAGQGTLSGDGIGLNENEMIGYLSKGDTIKLLDWPDKRIELDSYGYPNVRVEILNASNYIGESCYVELKACSFGGAPM